MQPIPFFASFEKWPTPLILPQSYLYSKSHPRLTFLSRDESHSKIDPHTRPRSSKCIFQAHLACLRNMTPSIYPHLKISTFLYHVSESYESFLRICYYDACECHILTVCSSSIRRRSYLLTYSSTRPFHASSPVSKCLRKPLHYSI